MREEMIGESDEERSYRRKQRIREMKRQKRKAELLQKRVFPAAVIVVLILTVIGIGKLIGDGKSDSGEKDRGQVQTDEKESQSVAGGVKKAGRRQKLSVQNYGELFGPYPLPEPETYSASVTAETTGFSSEVISEYGILIDVENSSILAQRSGTKRISPASMTKILTVLTAADALGIQGDDWENLPVLDEKFTITIEITDYSFVHDCSNVGFDVGEEVTVRDLFYGTILPSGADAALGLACYVAGSHEAFVELMNRKLEKMGLSDTTHIVNCIGLYDENHYSTAYDMAVILKTAADNPFCRDVLSSHTYNTSATEQHAEGILISNWFLRRIEDKDTHGVVMCAKTGYVKQSKSCAASLATDVSGKEYICVTAGSDDSRSCINDHVIMYQTWLSGGQSENN